MRNLAEESVDRLTVYKAELVEMCDNKPSYVQQQMLDNIDRSLAELRVDALDFAMTAMEQQCTPAEQKGGD